MVPSRGSGSCRRCWGDKMLGREERDGEDTCVTEPVSQGCVDYAELSIGKTM